MGMKPTTKKAPAKATKSTRNWFCDGVIISVNVSGGQIFLCAQSSVNNHSFALDCDQALTLASVLLAARLEVKP